MSDLDLRRVFKKAPEKMALFDNLITFRTKMIQMDQQDTCKLNNCSIFYAFLTGIT